MITIQQPITFERGNKGRIRLSSEPSKPKVPHASRAPRIAKVMALAIRFDKLIRAGKISDQSELARLTHVTQPRMTQIMNLNHLAPDIQEELLHLPAADSGKDQIHEKALRPITAELSWNRQRTLWNELKRRVHEFGITE